MNESTFTTVIFPLLIMAAGLFSAVCAILDVDWFMNSRKAQNLARFIGKKGARGFYILFGGALFVIGAVMLLKGQGVLE